MKRLSVGTAAQAFAIVALAALAATAATQQHAVWPNGRPADARLYAAIAIAALYLFACAVRWRVRPRRDDVSVGPNDDDATPLIVYASQTGFAHRIAELTAERLREGGLRPTLLPIAALERERRGSLPWANRKMALFVVSTTGEGDPPDSALGFVDSTMSATPSLVGLRYAILALGDRRYARYCAFGHALDAWLRRCGATPAFEIVEVDNGDGGALRHWQYDLARLPGMAQTADAPDWSPAPYETWRLRARRTLNPGTVGGEAVELKLWRDADTPMWNAGDIAEIGPRHPSEAVESWLRARGFDGDREVRWLGRGLSLRDALAQSHWPEDKDIGTIDANVLATKLKPLPHREYSIASIPEEGHLRLLVRRMRTPDGHPGLGSGWLCEYARLDGEIALRIRTNPSFHPPAYEAPSILIGNGTGLAGLRAHIAARAAHRAGRTWLLFGERQRAHDLFWADEVEAWRTDGTLARVDLAFSRDPAPEGRTCRYVQDLLRDAEDSLREWVNDGASILVCGSAAGMAPAVDEALIAILGLDRLAELRREHRYRRDVY